MIAFPFFVSAQDDSGLYKNQIKFSPVRMIDLFNPGLEISYERVHSGKFSSQFSYAFDKDIFGLFPFNNFRGNRFSLEEKYFYKSMDNKRKYVSLDLILNNNTYSQVKSYPDSVSGNIENRRNFFHRKTFSANIKYGKQFFLNRFIVDLSIGAGIKWRSLIPEYNYPFVQQKGFDFTFFLTSYAKYVTINIPMNVKIGYLF